MKDRKGNDLSVGDRVFFIPVKDDPDAVGGPGYVRRIKGKGNKEIAMVSDGPADLTNILEDIRWTWSTWADSSELEKI